MSPSLLAADSHTLDTVQSIASVGAHSMAHADSSNGSSATPPSDENTPAGPSSTRISYGATDSSHHPHLHVQIVSPEAETNAKLDGENGYDLIEYDVEDEEDALNAALVGLSWRYMSRLYLLIPLATVLFFAGLIVLVTYGWPPSADERDEGQAYPHPIFWRAFLVGLFASFTVQTLRVPLFVAISWLPVSAGLAIFTSTVLHAVLHEATRLVSVPLTIPSPTSGFHSSFYLGLGWGVAECAWGIVQGWEQLALYEDVMEAVEEREEEWCGGECEEGLCTVPEESTLLDPEDEAGANDDLAELEHRVAILERMRARQELEDIMGIPYPLIPFPLHLLWRIDTLLLNLGLTLILSGFYFDPEPLYRHTPPIDDSLPFRPKVSFGTAHEWPPAAPKDQASPWLPFAWCVVALLHVILALVWKVVGRVGVGSVTWGGLIVALGSVFAGLGVWGGVV